MRRMPVREVPTTEELFVRKWLPVGGDIIAVMTAGVDEIYTATVVALSWMLKSYPQYIGVASVEDEIRSVLDVLKVCNGEG